MPPSKPLRDDWGRASALFEGHGPKAILGQTPRQTEKKPTKDDGASKGSTPQLVKKQRIVKPADLAKSMYLESTDDVEGFLDSLRLVLEKAIANNERIQIR
jgi:hypothetical protein